MTRKTRRTGRDNRMDVVNPLAAGHLQRIPERPLAYPAFRKLLDDRSGRRDGRIDLRTMTDTRGDDAASPGPASASSCSRMWLARNEATYFESDRREFLAAQALAAPMITQLHALSSAVAAAQDAQERARIARASLPGELSAELLASRGPAETGDPDSVVAMRRSSEHQRVLAARDAAVNGACDRTTALLAEAARVRATLEVVFDVAITRTQMLREFHLRKADVYLRGYRRAVIRRRRQATLEFPGHEITVPAWTTQPCPWTSPPAIISLPLAI